MLLFVPVLLFAQEGEIPAPIVNWAQIMAIAIGTVGVTLAVQLSKHFLPMLPRSVKSFLTLVAGPLLMAIANALSDWLGYPIDFTSIIEVFGAGLLASGAAMVPFKLGKAQGKRTPQPTLRR